MQIEVSLVVKIEILNSPGTTSHDFIACFRAMKIRDVQGIGVSTVCLLLWNVN